MKKLNITFCSFPDYAGNAKALFLYMKKVYKNKMNYNWVIQDESMKEIIEKDGATAYIASSKEYEEYVPNTDIFFTTHANLTGEKRKAPNAIYIELWHGIGPKPIGYMAKNIKDSDRKWYGDIKNVIDYVIAPTELWRYIYASQLNINLERVLTLGLPLLDEIVYSKGKENLEKLLNMNLKKYKGIIMYMPTFRKGCGRELSVNYYEDRIFNLEKYEEEELLKYLKKKKYLLVVKRHPSDEMNYKLIENDYVKNINNDMLKKEGMNVNNILNSADLLITDYSSLGLEFSILDRPVIYISTDKKEYYNERGIIFDNYDFFTDGYECTKLKDMIKLINSMIHKEYKSKNKDLIYGKLEDGGCKQICDYFFDGTKISKNIKRHLSIEQELKEKNSQLEEICLSQDKDIKKLTERDIRLTEIENSKTFIALEKMRKIKMKFSNSSNKSLKKK